MTNKKVFLQLKKNIYKITIIWLLLNFDLDLDKFFPLDLMETGNDIVFFWVARMVMLSIALLGISKYNNQ